LNATHTTENTVSSSEPKSVFDRPRLEEFLDDTIPPIGHIDTEVFFERVTEETLKLVRHEYGPVVVDVASGMGMDSCNLAGRGFKVVSMEPQEDMMGYVRFHHKQNDRESWYVRGYAEELPLRDGSVDQVLCKGSIDHFLDPRVALAEMKRILKPGGRFIVAAANYDSLSCYLSRIISWINRKRYGPPPPGAHRPHHEIPSDHITRFNNVNFREMVEEFFAVRRVVGIGILWGTPYSNVLWDNIDPKTARKILNRMYNLARHIPSFADMTVIDCVNL